MAQFRKVAIVHPKARGMTLSILEEVHGTHAADLGGASVSRDVGRNNEYLPDGFIEDLGGPGTNGTAPLSSAQWLEHARNEAWLANYWNGVLGSRTIGHMYPDAEKSLPHPTGVPEVTLTAQEDAVCWAYFTQGEEHLADFRTRYVSVRESMDEFGWDDDWCGTHDLYYDHPRLALRLSFSDGHGTIGPVHLYWSYDVGNTYYTSTLLDTSTQRPQIALRSNQWPEGMDFRELAELMRDHAAFAGRLYSPANMRLMLFRGFTKKLLAYRYMLSLVSRVPLTGLYGARYEGFGDYYRGTFKATLSEVTAALEKRRDDQPKRKKR